MRYRTNKLKNTIQIPKEEFTEIKSFDEDQYIKDTFKLVFNSIQKEDWVRSIDVQEKIN